MIDKAIHEMFTAIKNRQIKWNDFQDIGVNEWYHDYYYAEEDLYLIHDRITDNIEFITAKSPKKAYETWREAHNLAVYENYDYEISGEKG